MNPPELPHGTRNILMILAHYYPEYGGGVYQCHTLAKALQQDGLGYRVSVVAGSNSESLPASGVHEGVPFVRLPNKLGRSLWRFLSLNVKLLRLFVQRRSQIDLVFCSGRWWAVWSSILFAKLLGLPVVKRMSLLGGDDPQALRRQHFGWAKVRLYALADRVVSTSSALSDSYLTSGLSKDKLVMIRNGVDLQRFQPVTQQEKSALRAQLGLPPSSPIVCYVGAIFKRKGTDFLWQAWKQLILRQPEAVLVLVGPAIDSSIADRIRTESRALGLDGRVRLVGFQDRVEQWLQAADVFVLPSRKEGLPNALLEAMACGLLCVARRIDGITSDVIDHGQDGFIVDDDVDQLANTLAQLLENPQLAQSIGCRARNKVGRHFSLDRIAREYDRLFRQVLGAHRDQSKGVGKK